MNEATNNGTKVPAIIGWRVDEEARGLLAKWRRRNPWMPWGKLIRRAVIGELKSIAGKRHAHLYRQ